MIVSGGVLSFAEEESKAFVNDILENVLHVLALYDFEDQASMDILEELFTSIDENHDNIATAAYQKRNELTQGACVQLMVYCIKSWFYEGGRFIYYHMAQTWLAHRMQELTLSNEKASNVIVQILLSLVKWDCDRRPKPLILQQLSKSLIKLGLALEAEEQLTIASQIYLNAALLAEVLEFNEITLLHERVSDLAQLLADGEMKKISALLDVLKTISQPGEHGQQVMSAINDLKEDLMIHKESYSHDLDRAILHALFFHLSSREAYKPIYEELKHSLALA